QRREPLPAEHLQPTLEVAQRARPTAIRPEVLEGLLGDVGAVQASVQNQQPREPGAATPMKMALLGENQPLLPSQQRPPCLALAEELLLADRVDGVDEVPLDVEAIEDDGGLRGGLARGADVAVEHVHRHHAKLTAAAAAELAVETLEGRLITPRADPHDLASWSHTTVRYFCCPRP